MEDKEEIISFDFYVKNFPFIKYLIDEKYLTNKSYVMIIIFYDYSLYQKYVKIKKDCDFMELMEKNFIDKQNFNSKEDGVYIICGYLLQAIDEIINDVFGEKRNLNEKELNSIDVIKGNKTDNTFYISLLKIYFFNSQGTMRFKYNDIISQYSNENSKE